MHGVTITELIEKMHLRNSTPQIDTDKIVLTHPDVNRPALQLTGFFDHFDRERVQIIGYVEQAYIKTMEREVKRQMFDKLTSSQIPCLVFSRGQEPMMISLSIVITTVFHVLFLIRPHLH